MRLSLLAVFAALMLAPAFARAATVPAQTAYSEVIGWGMQIPPKSVSKSRGQIADVNERIERAAYRYGIIKEFAMAVVATEGFFAPEVSYARSESWSVYEKATSYKMSKYPDVMSDLDTALSTLAAAMQKGKTVQDVLTLYWSGPSKSMNTDSLPKFIEYVNKIYNGLEPYARARLQAERSGKVKPSGGNYLDEEYSGWSAGGGAVANKDGFKSKLGTRPMKYSEMKYFEGHEEAYARQAAGNRAGDPQLLCEDQMGSRPALCNGACRG
jgi:hypothetical protein